MYRPRALRVLRSGLLMPLAVLSAGPAFSQESAIGEAPYRRQMTYTYQYFETEGLGTADLGTLDPTGRTNAHVLDFEFNQVFRNKWILTVGLPFITKRYDGMSPHTPWTIVPPHPESEFLDDGDYHSDFQDLRVGVRYLAKDGPVIVEPFAMLGTPTHDYTFFAQAAVGPNLDRLEVGVGITYQLPFSGYFFRFSPAYEFVEKTLGYNVDHWRLDAEVGYFVNARLSVIGFVSGRDGNGIGPKDVSPSDNNELWYQHDRLTRHNYLNVGVSVDYSLSERNRMTVALLRMVHAEDVHRLKFAVSFSVSRSF